MAEIKRLSARISADAHEGLVELCDEYRVSMTALVQAFLENVVRLKRLGEGEPAHWEWLEHRAVEIDTERRRRLRP